ncbi:MAG: hypothetical protein J1F43_06500 [Muribaculaceae bacterium]|nr:hypothetical protein [Muribaculaceae bacterium]
MTPDKEYLFTPFDGISFDSIQKPDYSVELIVRYSDRCAIKELPLKFETISIFNDSIIERELKVKLFNDDDEISGSGNYGIYQTQIPLFPKVLADENFFITFSTPERITSGLLSLGVKLDKLGKNETYSK